MRKCTHVRCDTATDDTGAQVTEVTRTERQPLLWCSGDCTIVLIPQQISMRSNNRIRCQDRMGGHKPCMRSIGVAIYKKFSSISNQFCGLISAFSSISKHLWEMMAFTAAYRCEIFFRTSTFVSMICGTGS